MGEIKIKGTLLPDSCYIEQIEQDVNLGFVNLNSLYDGMNSSYAQFFINFIDCKDDKDIAIKFTGEESSELPGFLSVPIDSGMASGFSIAITDENRFLIPINTKTNIYSLNENINSIKFFAYIKGNPSNVINKNIQLGQFNVVSTVIATYE